MSSTEQESLLCRVKFAEQMDRYEDAIELLNDMITRGIELGHEGRNLLSVAYKSVLAARRFSWRVLAACETKSNASESEKLLAKSYRDKVDEEYRNICNSLIKLIDECLLPKADDPETKVYLLKMKADYYRYLAEITFDEQRTSFAEKSMDAYHEASELSREKIKPNHPLRMGLALNHAVYYYEIMRDVDKACSLAKQAYNEARPELLHSGGEDTKEKRESLLILQLLQDNLTKWMGMAGNELEDDESHKENIDSSHKDS